MKANAHLTNGDAGAVSLHVERDIAFLTLARSDQVNAIDHVLARDLRSVVSELCERRDVRAIVLAGHGRAFSVGGDLKSFAGQGPNAPAYVRGIIEDLHAAILQLVEAPAPVISAVHGAAAGAGLGLALAGDIVIAADDAKFVMAYTAAGVTPDGGTSWILPRLVGLHRALDLTLRNKVLDAAEAHKLGLVAEICPTAELDQRARSIAVELAKGPTDAYVQARRLLRRALQSDLAVQLEAEGDAVVRAFAAQDGQEGARAFTERRAPRFQGCGRDLAEGEGEP